MSPLSYYSVPLITIDVLSWAYTLVFILFFNSFSNFVFWFLIECNMVIFISFSLLSLCFLSKMESSDVALFYFIIQSIGSMIFLFFSGSSFSFSYLSFSNFMIIISLLLKSGLFPFYFWLISLVQTSNALFISLILSIQKVPLYMFLFSISFSSSMFFLFFSLMSGSLMLVSCLSWMDILVWSSIYSSFWISIIFYMNFAGFLYFFLLYSFFIFFFCMLYACKIHLGVMDSVTFFLIFSFFLGLPPVSVFFFKFSIFMFVLSYFSFFLFILIWLFIFLSILGYSNFFFYSFFFSFEKFFPSFNSFKIFILGVLFPYFHFFFF